MDENEVKAIAELEDAHKTIEIGGRTFARKAFSPVLFDPRPAPIVGKTLTGLVDYINANRESVEFGSTMIHVESHAEVTLFEKFTGDEKKRTKFFEANLDEKMPVFPFDAFMPVEDFIIKANALFQPTDDLGAVIALVSKVTEQNQVTARDDGISQEVQVKKGISGGLTEGVTTRGTYLLAPYRTFRELMQPESRFILRLKAVSGELPRVALFDAEGGSWRLFAVKAIKDYLVKELEGKDIPVLS